MSVIDVDYLVVGAGLAGMGFVDTLVGGSDASVVLVDRREQPGGHWNDAYPFVRLHLPSATYGVNSRELGENRIDGQGPNAGFYERASGDEIVGYFGRVLQEQLLASGQVRFFGSYDYRGQDAEGHRLVSCLTGEMTTVRVRQRLVDASYLESSVPSRHRPSFARHPETRLVTPNDLARVDEPASGFTVLGAGKTAMDTCQWLLDQRVDPDRIRWIRPREPWILDRAYFQPLDRVATVVEGRAIEMEAAAEAEDVGELFRRLESGGLLMRLDPRVEPTMFHTPSLSRTELEDLRRIENVVRAGRVVRLGPQEIVLEHGTIPTDAGQVHIDCTARGLRFAPPCPIFEPGVITIQPVRQNQPAISAAILGHLEATREDDADNNRLCPPNPYIDGPAQWVEWTYRGLRSEARWQADPDLHRWVEASRLDLARGLREHLHERPVQTALRRFSDHVERARVNLERLRHRHPPVRAHACSDPVQPEGGPTCRTRASLSPQPG
jgi:hypothetical protein